MPGRLLSHADFVALESPRVPPSSSASQGLWDAHCVGKGSPRQDRQPVPAADLCLKGQKFYTPWHPTKHKERTQPYLPGTANPPSTLPLDSPVALRASPTSKAKQNKAVITKPRALTSAPSPDPKAQVAWTALPYKDTKTWAPNLQFHTTFRETCQQVPVLTTEPWPPGLFPCWNQLKQLVAH